MLQGAEGFDLALKQPAVSQAAFFEELEGYRASRIKVQRLVDGSHAAFAKRPGNSVPGVLKISFRHLGADLL